MSIRGASLRQTVRCTLGKDGIMLHFDKREGSFRPWWKQIAVTVHGWSGPARVRGVSDVETDADHEDRPLHDPRPAPRRRLRPFALLMEPARPSKPRLLLFAFGDFAFNLFWQSVMLFLLFYYTDALDIPIAVAATTYMVASVWDGIANFVDRRSGRSPARIACGSEPSSSPGPYRSGSASC